MIGVILCMCTVVHVYCCACVLLYMCTVVHVCFCACVMLCVCDVVLVWKCVGGNIPQCVEDFLCAHLALYGGNAESAVGW